VKLTVGVVLYKGEKYLKLALGSLVNQDYEDVEFLLRDQSPEGEALKYLEKYCPEIVNNPNVKLTQGSNRWHSGGHNAIIRQMTGDIYICASNDMLYEQDFCSKVAAEIQKPKNAQYGSFTVKLLRWDFERAESDLEGSKTEIIDSCGVGVLKNHYFFDRGQTESDEGQYDNLNAIFGGSGALVIMRKSALESIAYKNSRGETEYFDEVIHYKNDIDLAYRLQWAGEKCLFLSQVKVWHDRQVSNEDGNMSVVMRIVKNRKHKPRWVKESSYFGHLVLMEKNFGFFRGFSFSVIWATFWHQVKMNLYITFLEVFLWRQRFKFGQYYPQIKRRKKAMKRRVSGKDIEQFFSSKL
jgi:GT2 family glycosyltransferase